jgi:hypothetical protein
MTCYTEGLFEEQNLQPAYQIKTYPTLHNTKEINRIYSTNNKNKPKCNRIPDQKGEPLITLMPRLLIDIFFPPEVSCSGFSSPCNLWIRMKEIHS